MSNEKSQHADDQQFDISESSYKTTHTAVRKARRFALQGLYEWLMTDHRFEQTGHNDWQANAPHDIAARTRATNAMHTVHLGYYHDMMREIPLQIEALDAIIAKHLDRDISKIDMVEHAVLLIGAYELKNSLHIPYKVVLDESMKLNTHFGATDAHKLINAVMDKMAAELRAIEVENDTDYRNKEIEKGEDKGTNKDKDKTVETSLEQELVAQHSVEQQSVEQKDENSQPDSSTENSIQDTPEKTQAVDTAGNTAAKLESQPKPRISRKNTQTSTNKTTATPSND